MRVGGPGKHPGTGLKSWATVDVSSTLAVQGWEGLRSSTLRVAIVDVLTISFSLFTNSGQSKALRRFLRKETSSEKIGRERYPALAATRSGVEGWEVP